MANWNNEKIETYKIIRNIIIRGYFVKPVELYELYNSVFNKKLKPTNCSNCIKVVFSELAQSYRKYLKDNNLNDDIEKLNKY